MSERIAGYSARRDVPAGRRILFAEHLVILFMPRFTRQRARAKSLRMAELGRKSQAARAARRMAAIDPADLADLLSTVPMNDGTPLGSLQWHNFRSGKIIRWTVLRGNRVNNYRLRTPDGRSSLAHGLSWLLTKVRRVILRHS